MKQQTFAIRQARIFDGMQVLPRATLLVQDERIAALAEDVAIPGDATIIDGAGKTLLPGLIDAHAHVYGTALKQALIFGVTTELDMFSSHRLGREIKERQARGQSYDEADLRSAGTLVTAPGGRHATFFGIPIPTLAGPRDAAEFVDARLEEGSDYIKVIYEEAASQFLSPRPSIDRATLAAVIEAAHRRGKLVVVHIITLPDARTAIELGADGLAHIFTEQMPDPHFGQFVADHGAFVIPTLSIQQGKSEGPAGASLVADARLAPYLWQGDRNNLELPFPASMRSPHYRYQAASEAVRQLKAHGVRILAGTDAPNPGVIHGASLHGELDLLVQAGLTPVEALRAATSIPSAVFGLQDRGRLAVGLRADLVLVEGDPTIDITATRAIVGVWKQGHEVNRHAYQSAIEHVTHADQRPEPGQAVSRLVSDFEEENVDTQFGSGWQLDVDAYTSANLSRVPAGANGSKGSLQLSGVPTERSYWAAAAFFPGERPFAPANLSSKNGISFWAKGDGKTYRIMLYSGGADAMPATIPFVAGPDWRHFRFSFSDLVGVDKRAVLAVMFGLILDDRRFCLQIDDVLFF